MAKNMEIHREIRGRSGDRILLSHGEINNGESVKAKLKLN